MSIKLQHIYAWFVHIFTAGGGIFSVLAIISSIQAYAAKISANTLDFIFYLKLSFAYTVIAIVIDAIDGTLARQVNIKKLTPFDGGLLDNLIDFINYTVAPSIWIFIVDIVPAKFKIATLTMIVLGSCYQFCQINAKTKDHFFKGFPSYWNITVYYLIYFDFSSMTNFITIVMLFILVFIPIKYVYLSRMRYVSYTKIVLITVLIYTLIWGIATIASAIIWPKSNPVLTWFIVSYILFYFGLSVYRTVKPLHQSDK